MRDPCPSCPRCGYDQAGAIASWGRAEPAACPLDGLCSECGLTFWWRDLLNPVYTVQQRLFEHTRRRPLLSLLLTTWRALRPRRFWSWVRMEHVVVPRRMARGVAAGTVLVYLFSAAVVLGLVVASVMVKQLFGNGWWNPPQGLVRALESAFWPMGQDLYGPWGLQGRGPMYSWAVVSLLTVAAIPVVLLVLPDTLRQAKVRKIHLVRIGAYSVVGLPLVLAAGMIAHQVIDIILSVSRGNFGYDDGWFGAVDRAIMGRGRFSVLVLVCVWLTLWWGRASKLYLRLPRPYAATAAVVTISTLATLVVGFLLPGLGAEAFTGW